MGNELIEMLKLRKELDPDAPDEVVVRSGDMPDLSIREIEELKRDLGLLRDLVNDLADTGKCWYDHHGHCQEHGWFTSGVECPHARAQRLWDADGKEMPVSLVLTRS